jgi:hypothetical protein
MPAGCPEEEGAAGCTFIIGRERKKRASDDCGEKVRLFGTEEVEGFFRVFSFSLFFFFALQAATLRATEDERRGG